MNYELPDSQAGFRKGRGTRDQIANICWIIKKARKLQKTSAAPLLTMPKPLTVWITTHWKILKEMGIPDHLTCLMYESKEEPKSLLNKVKEESEKVGLKFSIQKTMIMASGPITSWQIDGETLETVTDLIFLGSKITMDGDYSYKMKRGLLLGGKAITNLDSVLKSRNIIL